MAKEAVPTAGCCRDPDSCLALLQHYDVTKPSTELLKAVVGARARERTGLASWFPKSVKT
jgi:hypothetical protein